MRGERTRSSRMRRSPPKLTLGDLSRPVLPEPNAAKSPVPPVVLARWIGLVERMSRRALNRFTKDTCARFDEGDLAALRDAILRRRQRLAAPIRP
jgi:hypothetical protein